ncbi:MAG TPA: MOSC N-terminal beta barrel domain-containing protein [Gemmatimonadales bacterium]
MSIRLTGLNIHPIKSARGIALDESSVDEFGLQYDRRWMVVDEGGNFLSQRSHPRLALVVPSISDGTLQVDAPGMPPLQTPLHPKGSVTTSVTVWDDTCPATWVGERAAEWFSEFLGTPCSLVHMADDVVRPANPAFALGVRVGFADAFPFLLISEESLADLNRRLADPLPMNRFRPNLVVVGAEPYGEDGWGRIDIGGVRFQIVKPCERCLVTTTDQATGERGKEPLRTLATYRKVGNDLMFGQNVVHENTGRLRVGDEVILR